MTHAPSISAIQPYPPCHIYPPSRRMVYISSTQPATPSYPRIDAEHHAPTAMHPAPAASRSHRVWKHSSQHRTAVVYPWTPCIQDTLIPFLCATHSSPLAGVTIAICSIHRYLSALPVHRYLLSLPCPSLSALPIAICSPCPFSLSNNPCGRGHAYALNPSLSALSIKIYSMHRYLLALVS